MKTIKYGNRYYNVSLDYSFLCPKRLTYTGTMNAILAKQNDFIFSVDDFLFLRKALISAGYEAPCSFCFVESARARFGKYNKQFLDLAKEEKLAYIPNLSEDYGIVIEKQDPQLFEDACICQSDEPLVRVFFTENLKCIRIDAWRKKITDLSGGRFNFLCYTVSYSRI